MVTATNVRRLSRGLAVSLLILLLPCTALAHGEGDGAMVTIGGYQVRLFFTEPAKAGGNPFHVHILDGMNMPVRGARVEISAMLVDDTQQNQANMESGSHVMSGMDGMSHDMSNMSGMPGMDTATAIASANDMSGKAGDYAGVITFSAAGHWMLNTHFTINGQALDADFPVDVVANHSASFAILAGFVSLNAFIIWVASVSRRKPVPA